MQLTYLHLVPSCLMIIISECKDVFLGTALEEAEPIAALPIPDTLLGKQNVQKTIDNVGFLDYK